MKYLITSILLAIAIFVTISARKSDSRPAPLPPSPPEWKYWDGKKPLNAKLIATDAAMLWYECGHKYFKFVKLGSTEKRKIDGIPRFRVKYYAKKCKSGKPEKRCRNGKCVKTGRIIVSKCKGKNELFQAIFKNEVINDKLRLNVTKLDSKGRSCAIIIKYHYH
uniref:Secreted protein n=1 Tax=Strongyloides papillosus TaxID=174720 RepID=A0A0N5C054_STREA